MTVKIKMTVVQNDRYTQYDRYWTFSRSKWSLSKMTAVKIDRYPKWPLFKMTVVQNDRCFRENLSIFVRNYRFWRLNIHFICPNMHFCWYGNLLFREFMLKFLILRFHAKFCPNCFAPSLIQWDCVTPLLVCGAEERFDWVSSSLRSLSSALLIGRIILRIYCHRLLCLCLHKPRGFWYSRLPQRNFYEKLIFQKIVIFYFYVFL